MNRSQPEKNLARIMKSVVQSGHFSAAETCSDNLWVIHTVQTHSFVTCVAIFQVLTLHCTWLFCHKMSPVHVVIS